MRAILFPGQGAQYVGMGRDFHAKSAAARDVFERADRALGMELSRICFEGPEERLAETDVCQPAILTTSAAIVAALEETGRIKRDDFAAAAGLSLGEYTALWYAGAMDFEDAVRLVHARGRGMQEASEQSPSGMISLLRADEAKVQEVVQAFRGDDVLVAANFLAPGNTAVSGSAAALDRVEAGARELKVRAVRLKVAGAFHSPLMQPACAALEEVLAGMELREPRIPVISNVTAAAHDGVDAMKDILVRQVTSPVLWEKSMAELKARGVGEFLEPGPGSVLTGLLRKIDRDLVGISAGKVEDMDGLALAASDQGDEA